MSHTIFLHRILPYCNKKDIITTIFFSSKYSNYISKSSQTDGTKYFQFAHEKNIG